MHVTLLLLLLASQLPIFITATLVLTNSRIYTVDESNPWAEAIVIDDNGIIVAVGSTEEIQTFMNDTTTNVLDLQQRLVLPGFQDAHLHAVEAGINAELCYIDEDAFVEDIPFYFQDCPNGGLFADQGWIVGAGIDVGLLLDSLEDEVSEYPITILDRAYPDTPVLILDNIGHGAVANTAAMAAAGYDTLTGNPPGGILVRDEFTNELTGIVLENAQQPLRDAAFPPTEANQERAYQSLLDALVVLAQNGITTVSDAGGFYRQAQTESWIRAEEEGVLTVRASNALYVYPDTPLQEQLDDLVSRYSNSPNRLVRFNQAKIYVDGILSLLTAALYEPYESSLGLSMEDELGFEYFGDSNTLFNMSKTLSDLGFQLHFHVTGDRGAGLALDAIAQSNAMTGPHRLTHCYLVDPVDRGRFAELNAVADFQLAPSSLDPLYTEFMADIIGTTRASQLLPALEVYNASAVITLSSDWDADVLSPVQKIQTVLTRADRRSFPNVESVIPLLTLNPAILLQHSDMTGSIEVGKFADIAILDRNIFTLPVEEIHTGRVVLTMLQGEPIYDPDGLLGDVIGTLSLPASSVMPEYKNLLLSVGAPCLLAVLCCSFF